MIIQERYLQALGNGSFLNKLRSSMKQFIFLSIFFCFFVTQAQAQERTREIIRKEENVYFFVHSIKNYIELNGKEKSIAEFNEKHTPIFIIDYQGNFLASSIYPQWIGTNQFDLKDAAGILVVQQEIEKAKAGGGWLKGRWRLDPVSEKFACRKMYILPMKDDYFIGSWYFYPAEKEEDCDY